MKKSRIVGLIAVLLVLAGKLGQLSRVLRHSEGVTLCVFISFFNGTYKGCCGLVKKPLHTGLFFIETFHLDLMCTLHRIVDIKISVDVQGYGHKYHGHIYYGNTVGKYLKYSAGYGNKNIKHQRNIDKLAD